MIRTVLPVCDRATKPEAVQTTINRTTIAVDTAAYRTTVVEIRILIVNSRSPVRGHRINLDDILDEEKMIWTEAAERCTVLEAEVFGLI